MTGTWLQMSARQVTQIIVNVKSINHWRWENQHYTNPYWILRVLIPGPSTPKGPRFVVAHLRRRKKQTLQEGMHDFIFLFLKEAIKGVCPSISRTGSLPLEEVL
jgi:hypothetical protein